MGLPFPKRLTYRTLDEVAERYAVSGETYVALWRLMPPDEERFISKFWDRLDEKTQQDIIDAVKAEHD